MKVAKIILALAVLFVTVYSCTKVVDVDLNNASPAIVIEGVITNQPGPYSVSIIKTVNFSASNIFPTVSGATVQITDATSSVTETLAETSPGVYTTRNLLGTPGHTYQLYVSAEGKEYTASSTMPVGVTFDSLTYERNLFFGEIDINATVHFQDPPGTANYYTFAEWIRGKKSDWTHCVDDRISDGRYISAQLWEDSLAVDDVVTVQMNCVDRQVFNYFNTLSQATGGGDDMNAVTPSNPISNISNNALGYFSAHTVQSITKTVK